MRKIAKEIENPLDNILIDLGEVLSPYFKRLSFTPNTLTTISLICGLYAVYMYTKREYMKSAIYYFISHIFDCFDGFYARKYKMTSSFGDNYDHVTDVVVAGMLMYVMWKKYRKLKDWRRYMPCGLILLGIPMAMHIGCQELYYAKNESGSLTELKAYCPTKVRNNMFKVMMTTRYFGTGTWMMYMYGLILYSKKVDEMTK